MIIFNNPVYKCGSNKVIQGCQIHDHNGNFHTKKWWQEHPDIKTPDIQKTVAVFDPTDYKCFKCNYQITYTECEVLIEPLLKQFVKTPYIEEVGMAIFNPKALRKLRSSKC